MENVNIITIFLTGLITGGLTCMAVQGGLLAATLAQREEERLKEKVKKGQFVPILSFLAAKLIAYTFFGFLLGLIGSAFQLSLTAKIIMQIAVAIFMIGTAFNILHVHPIFRYFVIQPPRFLTRLLRKESKSESIFAPAILGAFTVFIPCGTTQAMIALSIASGSPLYGAAILFAFVLGTSPIFFILGYFATKLGDTMQQKFMKVAAYAIIFLAVFNVNNALALTGSNFTLERISNNLWCVISYCSSATSQVNNAVQSRAQEIAIIMEAHRYTPDILTVKAGSQVKLHLKNVSGVGCIQAFTIPKLGVEKVIPVGGSTDIVFTAPDKPGELPFMCSMGMYRGMIHVI